jgi:predicted RNase H-like HicB family nuclease
MKTYSFKVVVEPDDDRWHAHCPALERYGASTWGNTEREAFRHIHEVVRMVIAELTEDGIGRLTSLAVYGTSSSARVRRGPTRITLKSRRSVVRIR